MKKITLLFKKLSIVFILLAIFQSKNIAQTTLVAGDIAFTGYLSAAGGGGAVDDKFSFVLMQPVLANTKIKFTDIGWTRTSPTTGSFQPIVSGAGENIIEWTAPALSAGTEVTINNLTASHGTVIFVNGGIATQGLSLSTSGDQVLAFQGTEANPTFISGIHMNVYINGIPAEPITTTADWDGAYITASSSGLPKGLTNGLNAIWIGTQGDINSEEDNAKFNGCGLNLSTISAVNSAVNNKANWTTSDGVPAFTLPSGCTFLPNVTPSFATHPANSTSCASLIVTFSATTTSGGNTFKWQEATNSIFTTGLVDINASGGLFTLTTSGGNSSSLSISDNTTKNGKYYRCVASNGAGPANSNGALLTATNNTFPTGIISASTATGAGNSSFVFASGCRLLGKIVPGNVSGNITVEHWVEGAVPNVAGVPFVQRHYQITPDAGSTGTITLYFTQADFNNYNAFNSSTLDNLPTSAADATGKANLRITKYNGSSNDFSGLPASYTNGSEIIDPVDANIVLNTGVTPNRWEITFPVTSFSGFTVAGAVAAPLPVKLTSFIAKVNSEKQAQLIWKVAEQSGIQQYEVEKSIDAKNFDQIGKVEANNATITEYQFLDPGLEVGSNYYRLKIFEQNGEFNFSKIVSIDFKPEITTILYPNPSSDYLKIDQIGDFTNQSADIFDAKGKFLKSIKLKKEENISIKELSAGIYFIKLANGKSIKFLKN